MDLARQRDANARNAARYLVHYMIVIVSSHYGCRNVAR